VGGQEKIPPNNSAKNFNAHLDKPGLLLYEPSQTGDGSMSQTLTNVQPVKRLAHRIKDAAVIAGLSRRASQLAVRYEPIVALRLDPQNPRLHSRKQLRQIANSIKSFGFNVPVLDAEQSFIAGHGRVLGAKELGWTEVPVIAIEHLDAAQRRAFAIADNRVTENSTWHDRLLADQLKELSILDLSFDDIWPEVIRAWPV
jgi:ParB-like nuclease domain